MDKQPTEPEAVRQLRAAFAVLTVARDACQAFTGDMEPREWQEWWSLIRPVIERALAATGRQPGTTQVEAAMTTLRNAMDSLAAWKSDLDPETRARMAPLIAKIVSQATKQSARATRQASLVPASGGDRILKVIEELHHALLALARVGDDLPAARKAEMEATIRRMISQLIDGRWDDEEGSGDAVTTR